MIHVSLHGNEIKITKSPVYLIISLEEAYSLSDDLHLYIDELEAKDFDALQAKLDLDEQNGLG